MTRIEQVKQQVEEKGYELVSAEGYKNQESLITVRCKKGHLTQVKFSDFKHPSFTCPQCDAAIKFVNPIDVPEKQGFRVIAFDQATEKFGVSVFDGGKLVFFNLFMFNGLFTSRLVQIKKFVEDVIIAKWKPDYIVMEDIQYQVGRGVITYKTLAMLLGVLEELCSEKNVPYEVVSPNVWRKFAGTAGKTRLEEKQLSVITVKEKYGVKVNDDVAEAILIGRYGASVHAAEIKSAFGR